VKATYKDGVLEVRAHVDRTQASGTTIPVSHQ
jgi:HSP20 family molecular chaperone IbpA